MYRALAYPPAIRVSAAGLTLLVHGLFALLLLLEERMPDRPLPPSRKLAGLWIHMPLAGIGTQPLPDVTPAAIEPQPPAPDEAAPRSPQRPRPDTAITLPAAGPAVEPVAPPGGAIDWRSEAARHAVRAAEALEQPPTFSPPPDKMRRPCKPRKSSFEWKDKPPEDEPEVNPLLPPTDSVKMGGARVGTIGFSIRLGPKPEPNKHLFDDMKAGRTPYSSVPDPNYCD